MTQTLAAFVLLISMLVSILSGTGFVKQDKLNPQLTQTSSGGSEALESDLGTLTIASTPAGADIYIDGSRYAPAVTPASIDLPAGITKSNSKSPATRHIRTVPSPFYPSKPPNSPASCSCQSCCPPR